MKKKSSIYKQYAYFALLVPALILITGVIISFINYQIVKKDREILYLNAASKINNVIDISFNYIAQFAEIVGEKISSESSLNDEKIGKILKETYAVARISQDIGTLTKFDFVTADGKVIANVTQGALRTPLFVKKNEGEWMTLAAEQPWKLHISSEIVKGIAPNGLIAEYGIPVGLGITNREGIFLGTVLSGVDVTKLANRIADSLNLESAKFIVLNDQFELIAQSNSKSHFIFNETEKLRAVVADSPKIKVLSSPIQYDGGEYYVYRHVDDYPFIILVGENKEILENEYRKKVVPPAILSIFLGAWILSLFHYFRSKIIKPVKELSDLADEIVDGKSDIVIPTYNYTEIQNLADNIRKIKDYTVAIDSKRELEKSALQLKDSNLILEQRVDERTKELQNALEVKTEFLNNISHEIRAPINGFSMAADNLINHWKKLNEERRYEMVEMIAKSAKRINDLTAHLIELSKLSSKNKILKLQEVNLCDLIKDIVDECQDLYLDNKKIGFVFKPKKQYYAKIDKEAIGQVLRNILVNSTKFSPDDSIITLTIKELKKELVISISDIGVGIPADELKTIFNPFTQSSRTKSSAGGTGLGLAIAKQIVEQHGGEIYALNNEKRGCSFIFTLPVLKNIYIGKKNNAGKILVIDDEEIALNVIETGLTLRGFKVVVAAGGVEGLKYLQKHHEEISIVLLDLMMPGIYGLEVLKVIKEKYPQLIVIIQSGIADDDEIGKALSLGADDFFRKPYKIDDVVAVISNFYQF